MIKRDEIVSAYAQFSKQSSDVLLTPDVAYLLRGLMKQTPNRMAQLSSVKKNQLLKYERGERHLSVRDKGWLCAVFKAAGAEIFMAQGHLQVRYQGTDVIVNGQVSDELKDLRYGVKFREMRRDAGLSQKVMQRQSGVPQHIISAIENYRHRQCHLVDLLEANRFLKQKTFN